MVMHVTGDPIRLLPNGPSRVPPHLAYFEGRKGRFIVQRLRAVAVGATVLTVGLVLSACGGAPGADIDITDDELAIQVPNWPNQVGLGQTDHEVWRARLQRACAEGVWDFAVAERLAAEFIEEDLPLSVRGDSSVPDVLHGSQALWLMARNACGELFPQEALDKGPPGVGQ